MAKESKQDRTVRLMIESVTEHFHELKAIEANPNNKEIDVEKWAQTFLKSSLGYSVSSGYSIRSQEQKGKHRPDLTIYQGESPIFVVEVKKLGFNLDKSDFRCGKIQLQEYLYSLGKVPYGILCNGYEWRLYDFNNPNGIIEILSFDLRNDDDKLEFNKKFIEDLCYDFVNIHETSFRNKDWPDFAKEATAFSSESLTKAILCSNVVKMISKEIRGEHEYKANIDMLFTKIYDLLAKGLDDSLKDFNETKQAEFHKYIKSQIRATRKTKKVVRQTESVETSKSCEEINIESINDKAEVA